MLTAIGRAAAQRLLLRAAPLAIPRSQLVVRVACRAFSTTQWARLPAKATSSTTTTKKAAAPKKKVVAKKPKAKKAVKKPAAKKRVKKELTPEEKLKLDVRAWKKAALLTEPKLLPATAWTVYSSQQNKSQSWNVPLANRMKQISEDFKNLSSYEAQRLQQTAEENKLTNNAAYKAWVESHTPQEVADANRARARLRSARGKDVPRAIRDERQPKRPQSAYTIFTAARWANGDFAGQRANDVSRRLADEWKNLPQSEKATYEDLAKATADRYARETLSVLGRTVKRSQSPE
ncbi:HMG box protein [Colletotrichum truncatum]|uniref:HMG box protein n=1 Tax=Colletotrichum truncatum TaxID=5467 RepID=A0ACC3Z4C8_COLTU|nr:HMG box protein [Colletotrichum truncatum]KAF6795778.1 HMG box protein [Colletotrichum truncatum]